MATSAEIGLKLDTERRAMAAWYAGFKTDAGLDMTAEQVGEFNTRNEALAKMQGEYAALLTAEKGAAENEAKMASQGRLVMPTSEPRPETKIATKDALDDAMGAAFKAAAPRLQGMAKGEHGSFRFELPVEHKTVATLTDHYPAPTRAQTTGMALYYNSVEDLFRSGTTDANSIAYFIQSTDTANAAFVAEGSAVTDDVYTWTYTTDEVETVQAWIPVTREFLNDNAGMQSLVTGMLMDRLNKKVSQELMYGTGTTPHLWGVTVRTNFASQAKGTDPIFDTFLKAIDKVTVAGDAVPDAVVIHPTDLMGMLLTRTTDGIYIMGNPANANASPTIWGLPIRATTTCAAAAGTACVGAFGTMAQVFNNGGLVVEASTEYSTYFTERKVALAVSRRLSAVNFRPTAFVKVTGL